MDSVKRYFNSALARAMTDSIFVRDCRCFSFRQDLTGECQRPGQSIAGSGRFIGLYGGFEILPLGCHQFIRRGDCAFIAFDFAL